MKAEIGFIVSLVIFCFFVGCICDVESEEKELHYFDMDKIQTNRNLTVFSLTKGTEEYYIMQVGNDSWFGFPKVIPAITTETVTSVAVSEAVNLANGIVKLGE